MLNMKTMQAIRIHQYGHEDVLSYEQARIPDIGEDDVLIKVMATSVNPIDWKVREGFLRDRIPHNLPLILGWDVSGIIEACGKNVHHFSPGDEVYSHPNLARDGSYAEYICVNASEITYKPQTLSHKEAASLPLAGINAWKALIEVGELQSGQNVLIHEAAGGVGSLAVQIAKSRDTYVFGATSRSMELLEELGVDSIINYETENFYDKVVNIDFVLDTLGGGIQGKSWSVLGFDGMLASLVSPPSPPGSSEARRLRHAYVTDEPDAESLKKLTMLVDKGALRPVIGHEFPLHAIAEAHQLSRSGQSHGKIVISVASP